MPELMTVERRAERLDLATAEARDIAAWKAGGEVGDKPDTPNLDELEEERTNPDMSAKRTTSKGPGRPKQTVRFAVDGVIQSHKTRGYTLGYLAYDHTAGLAKGNAKRLTTGEFKAELAKAGVKDPTGSSWGPITLGGKVFQAVARGEVPAKVDKPKPAAKAAPAKRAAKKATKAPAKKATARKATAKKATKKPAGRKRGGLRSVPTGSKIVPRPPETRPR